MKNTERNHAVAIIVLTPEGVPLVQDLRKPQPCFWKFPGGRQKDKETPVQTAKRELLEETGIEVKEEEFEFLYEELRESQWGPHNFFLFRVKLDFAPKLLERGNDGELIQLVQKKEILQMSDFFPNHKTFAEKFLA